MTFMLVSASILNTLYLFTRTKTYFLNLASEPVSSPHASFIKRPRTPHRSSSDDLVPRRSVPALLLALLGSLFSALWRGLVLSTRFLLNLSPPKARAPQPWEESERVQQLEVWTPGALEMALFSLYSPVHSLLWIATTSANWMLTFFIMFIVGVQVCRFFCVWKADVFLWRSPARLAHWPARTRRCSRTVRSSLRRLCTNTTRRSVGAHF